MEGVFPQLKGLTIRTNDKGDIIFVLHIPSLMSHPTNATGVIRGFASKRDTPILSQGKVYTHHLPLKYTSDKDIPSTDSTTELQSQEEDHW